jgi:bifunctional non-homologous end joining protein LigD
MIRYYTRVAPWLLPHLKDRPLTLTRYPNGIASSLFYQKHYTQPIPEFVDTVQIWSSHNEENGTYITCNNLATLVWLAQIADLEIHAWMSRVDPEPDARDKPLAAGGSEAEIDASVLNYPDFMIFDLDPYIYAGHEKKGAEPEFNRAGWGKTVEMALALKELLDSMRLSSYVKTTGKTGLHVYSPILRLFDYDEIRAMTAQIGRHLMALHPKDLTMEWDTQKRTDKVFFDHNQNTRGKTLAAEYSLRPTPWAGASMPVTWSELPNVDPIELNMDTLPERLEKDGDPWADILAHKTDLSALLGG